MNTSKSKKKEPTYKVKSTGMPDCDLLAKTLLQLYREHKDEIMAKSLEPKLDSRREDKP